MKKKQIPPTNTSPNNYTFYDRKNEICWIVQPPISEQSKKNTGLTEDTLDYLRYNLNTWQDDGVQTYIVDDQKLGDYLLGDNLTEYNEKSIAFAVQLDVDDNKNYAFMEDPSIFLFNSHDNLYDDVKILGTITFSPCANDGDYSLDYLVVNNKYRNKGLGYRLVKSFSDNTDFFTNYKPFNTLFATVREDNEPCKGMLKKMDFVVSHCNSHNYPIGKRYTVYKKEFCDEMENT